MGSPADAKWVAHFAPELKGKRVLEAGAGHKDAFAIREVIAREGGTYIGTDLHEHSNVSIVHNLNKPLDIEVDAVICLSVLEHCDKVWKVAENLERVLVPGGLLLVAAPFSWRIHHYPSDYWRFTPYGFKSLFENVVFKEIFPAPMVDLENEHPRTRIQLYGWGRKKEV